MISEIIKVIQCDDWKGVSDNMEIAKGRYEILETWGDLFRWFKRIIKWPKR